MNIIFMVAISHRQFFVLIYFFSINPAKPQYRNMCQKFFSICIYVKIALTKEKKFFLHLKISPAKKFFFCDIYVTYSLEGCMIGI